MTDAGLFQPGTYASIPKELLAEPNLSAAAKVVYLGLASYADCDTVRVWPGPAALRKRTGLTRRAIQKNIEKLIAAGWIRKESRGGPEGTNLYTIHPQRTPCASAPNAPPLAHERRASSARRAPEVLHGSTPVKYSNRARGKATTPDPRVKQFIDFFAKTYREALGREYVVTPGKDGATIKRLLRSVDGDGKDPVAELQRATGAMLADPWGRDRASIGLLAGQINTWLGGPGRNAGKGSRTRHVPAPAADVSQYAAIGRDFAGDRK
jgi:hypothetical protein